MVSLISSASILKQNKGSDNTAFITEQHQIFPSDFNFHPGRGTRRGPAGGGSQPARGWGSGQQRAATPAGSPLRAEIEVWGGAVSFWGQGRRSSDGVTSGDALNSACCPGVQHVKTEKSQLCCRYPAQPPRNPQAQPRTRQGGGGRGGGGPAPRTLRPPPGTPPPAPHPLPEPLKDPGGTTAILRPARSWKGGHGSPWSLPTPSPAGPGPRRRALRPGTVAGGSRCYSAYFSWGDRDLVPAPSGGQAPRPGGCGALGRAGASLGRTPV